MASGKRSRADALRERLEVIAQRYTQSEISRRTGTPITSVHRYLRTRRVPSSFCAALVQHLDVNPNWLLAGEGMPWLAEVRTETGQMADGLLELVAAMNSLERTRLGSLAATNTTQRLVGLSQTIRTYEEIRERINGQCRPVLRQILKDWARAIFTHKELESEALSKVAPQLWRMCDDADLAREFYSVSARYQSGLGNKALAFELNKKALLAALSTGAVTEVAITEAHRVCIALSHEERIPEALHYSRAVLLLARETARHWPRFAMLEAFHGFLLVKRGLPQRGVNTLKRALPRLEPYFQDQAYATALYGLLLLGAVTFDSVASMTMNKFIAEVLQSVAFYLADRRALEIANGAYKSALKGNVSADHYRSVLCNCALAAIDGRAEEAIGSHLAYMRELEESDLIEPTRHPDVDIDHTQLLRLCGKREEAKAALLFSDRILRNLGKQYCVELLRQTMHHRNVLELLDHRPKLLEERALVSRARKFFARQRKLGHLGLILRTQGVNLPAHSLTASIGSRAS